MKFLVADDHAVTRRGIREVLVEAFDGVVIHEASTSDEVLAAVLDPAKGPWNLVILDVLMPGAGVVDVLTAIRAANAALPVLILTAATEVEYVTRTLAAGATGVVHKHHAADDLIVAVRRSLDGHSWLHPDTAAELAAAMGTPDDRPHESLSKRELEVFRRIALGQTVKEIAYDLGISDKTVATYMGRIRDKTDLSSNVAIARYALRHGLVR